jgi:hypothetical protein
MTGPRPTDLEPAFRDLGATAAIVLTLIAVGLVWLVGGFGL